MFKYYMFELHFKCRICDSSHPNITIVSLCITVIITNEKNAAAYDVPAFIFLSSFLTSNFPRITVMRFYTPLR